MKTFSSSFQILTDELDCSDHKPIQAILKFKNLGTKPSGIDKPKTQKTTHKFNWNNPMFVNMYNKFLDNELKSNSIASLVNDIVNFES